MADQEFSIKVSNARELRSAIRKMGRQELGDDLKKANKAAAETVADRAKTVTVPVDSGNLKKSIRALGSKTKGQVKAGAARGGTRDYAGIVHYGDPNRGRDPQPFLHEAASDEWNEVMAAYEAALDKISKSLSTN